MQSVPFATTRPGLTVGALFGVTGAAFSGFDAAILGAILGYFLAKSLQSIFWTFTHESTA